MSDLPKESQISGDFISAGASSQQSHGALLARGGFSSLALAHAETSLVGKTEHLRVPLSFRPDLFHLFLPDTLPRRLLFHWQKERGPATAAGIRDLPSPQQCGAHVLPGRRVTPCPATGTPPMSLPPRQGCAHIAHQHMCTELAGLCECHPCQEYPSSQQREAVRP